MLKTLVAVLAGSQVKLMGIVGGVSLLINQFSQEISRWISVMSGHSIRPEILDVLFSLFTIAMMGTVVIAFVLYVVKSFARIRKSYRVGSRLSEVHMQTVSALAAAIDENKEGGEVTKKMRESVSELVSEVERLQKKSKRLCARDPELKAAFEDYVHRLTVFSAATGGAAASTSVLAEATEAVFALLSAFGMEEKGRKLRNQRKRVRTEAAEVDHYLCRAVLETSPDGEEAGPDVIARTQEARGRRKKRRAKKDKEQKLAPEEEATPDISSKPASTGNRMSRRDRKKLGPMDQPGRYEPT